MASRTSRVLIGIASPSGLMIGIRGCDSWTEFRGTAPEFSFRKLLGLGFNMLGSPALCLTNLVSHISFCSSHGLSWHGIPHFAHFPKPPSFSFHLPHLLPL